MKIGIIGAGKVGCSIGKYLKEHCFSVAGYCSKSKKSVEEALFPAFRKMSPTTDKA